MLPSSFYLYLTHAILSLDISHKPIFLILKLEKKEQEIEYMIEFFYIFIACEMPIIIVISLQGLYVLKNFYEKFSVLSPSQNLKL